MSNLRTRLVPTTVRLALGTGLIVLAAACGSSAPTTAGAGSSAAVGTGPAPTSAPASTSIGASPLASAIVPPATASSGSGASSGPVIGATHADPALEAMLPASIGGSALQVSSLTLKAVLDAGGDRPAIDGFLAMIGKSEADGSVALAVDLSGNVPGGITAFKVTGADAASLLAGLVALQRADLGSAATATAAKVGGKSVTVLSIGTGVNDNVWIYGRGDVVFVIKAPDADTAAVFLTLLP